MQTKSGLYRNNQTITIDLHNVGPHIHGPHWLCHLLVLLVFKLSFWDGKKERLESLSVLSLG